MNTGRHLMRSNPENSCELALESGSKTFGPGEWCGLETGAVYTEQTDSIGATLLLAYK
jgi:hypothetical protein